MVAASGRATFTLSTNAAGRIRHHLDNLSDESSRTGGPSAAPPLTRLRGSDHHNLTCHRRTTTWPPTAGLENTFSAHALVHLAKHNNMEWLPGKNVGMSAAWGTDAAIGNMPLIYPFLINDPGEGTQAKRRAHATIVDHLVPPMVRAESYGDIARLEQLLDEHASIAAMDPAKLPAVRAQIWTLIQAAKMDHDLGMAGGRPDDTDFDDFILHADGWLCEIKDMQICDGLHVFGQAPVGEARVNLVLAMLRATQVWGGVTNALPGLRAALGLKDGAELAAVDAVEAQARSLVLAAEAADWRPLSMPTVVQSVLPESDPSVLAVMEFAATEVVPRLAGTTAELTSILHALDGGFVSAGPSGSPLRGLINVLLTGRNFYSVDPRPSRPGWRTTPAARWPNRWSSVTCWTTASTRSRWACRCGAPRRCAPPATTSPKCWR